MQFRVCFLKMCTLLQRMKFRVCFLKMCTLFQKMQFRVCFLKMCTLFQKKKNAISCLFLKNISPSKRFILNNLHFPMVEGIAFYALYKSRVQIIPCKADDFCLFIGLPNRIKKSRLVWLTNLEFYFLLFCRVTLRKHYITKATWAVI